MVVSETVLESDFAPTADILGDKKSLKASR